MDLQQILTQLNDNGKRTFLERLAKESQSEDALTELVGFYVESAKTHYLGEYYMGCICDALEKLDGIKSAQKPQNVGSGNVGSGEEKPTKKSTSRALYNSAFTRLIENAIVCSSSSENYEKQVEEINLIVLKAESRVSPSVMYDICQSALSKFNYDPNDKRTQRNGSTFSPRHDLGSILKSAANAALKLKNTEKVEQVVTQMEQYCSRDKDLSIDSSVEIRSGAYLGAESLKDWGDIDGAINSRLRRKALRLIEKYNDRFTTKNNWLDDLWDKEKGINTGETCNIMGKCYEKEGDIKKAEEWYKKGVECHLRQGRINEAFEIAQYMTSEVFIVKKIEKETMSEKEMLARGVEDYNSLVRSGAKFGVDTDCDTDCISIQKMQEYQRKLETVVGYVSEKKQSIENIERRIRDIATSSTVTFIELAETSLKMLMNKGNYEKAYDVAQRIDSERGQSSDLTNAAITMYNMLNQPNN